MLETLQGVVYQFITVVQRDKNAATGHYVERPRGSYGHEMFQEGRSSQQLFQSHAAIPTVQTSAPTNLYS